MTANTPQSRKQKGRKLQQTIRDILIKEFNLPEEDVKSTSMGASGCDVTLSNLAREVIPFAIESKNTESLNIWSALEQAESNATEDLMPLVVFKRNRSEIYCALKFEDLVNILKDTNYA